MSGTKDALTIILNHREVVAFTDDDDYRYLQHHWGSVYVIIRPGNGDETWMALARFGNRNQLSAGSADELLELIRLHYIPGTIGYEDAQMMGRS